MGSLDRLGQKKQPSLHEEFSKFQTLQNTMKATNVIQEQ